MKNLDITIVAPQGAGKSHLARGIFKIMDVAPERTLEVDVDAFMSATDLTEALRINACDAVVIDIPLNCDLLLVAGAVDAYRDITRRNVCAVYCVQATQKEFLTYKS